MNIRQLDRLHRESDTRDGVDQRPVEEIRCHVQKRGALYILEIQVRVQMSFITSWCTVRVIIQHVVCFLLEIKIGVSVQDTNV